MTLVRHRSTFACSPETLFAFHADVSNLPRISPPLPRVRLLSAPGRSQPGDEQLIEFALGPIRQRWHARITHVIPPRLVEDVQERGPFRRWRHQHRITSAPGGAALEDVIAFRVLPTVVGEFVEWALLRPALKAMLIYRHGRTRALLGV